MQVKNPIPLSSINLPPHNPTHGLTSFDRPISALYQRHQELKQGNLWTHYYSQEVIMMSDKARSEWVPPNLQQLPS